MLNGPIQFDEFSLDCARYELLRAGRSIKLEKIPMELLILLVEKEGHLVTRQEIIERIWGKDVFVDTEHGINTAVRKVRQALRDDCEAPRFIQTVAGKGYRFAGEKLIAPRSSPLAEWSDARPGVSVAPGHVMLAVLPFANLSGDPGQDYFSDGLTEEMIAQVGALSPDQLGVIARTTAMVYKQTSKSVQQIGTELSVDYVLESSLRRDSERVRISAQLIRASDQVHIWAQNYDRPIGASIALQEEVARAIADQIKVKLCPSYASRAARSHPDPQANEAYLRGRYFGNQFTEEGYHQAIAYFQQAIDRDPSFGEAYAGLAESYRFLVVTDTISPSEGTPKVANSARQAVLLGDGLAESHNSLAEAMMDQWDWPGAEGELKRAIALNPSYSRAHRIYGAHLAAQRRHGEAWEQICEAMRSDPLSLPNNAEVVRTLYYARDYDGAIAQARKAMQLDPDYYRTHFWLGRVYAQKGMYREAIAEAEKVVKATPDSTLGLTEMAYCLAVGGREAEAEQILRRLEERAKTGFVPAYNLAVIHVALKQHQTALKCLQQSYDEHDWAMMVLATEPRFDPLRRDPLVRALSASVGLAP